MMRAQMEYFGSRERGPTGDSNDAIGRAWAMMEDSLRYTAERLTEDSDEQEDLLQEALIQLWITDPTRFDLGVVEERSYLKRMLVNRMWQVRGACMRVT